MALPVVPVNSGEMGGHHGDEGERGEREREREREREKKEMKQEGGQSKMAIAYVMEPSVVALPVVI